MHIVVYWNENTYGQKEGATVWTVVVVVVVVSVGIIVSVSVVVKDSVITTVGCVTVTSSPGIVIGIVTVGGTSGLGVTVTDLLPWNSDCCGKIRVCGDCNCWRSFRVEGQSHGDSDGG